MSALSALRIKAAEKYPAYSLDLENGTIVTLKSIMDLDDAALDTFSESQKRLTSLEDSDDLTELRTEFVDVLALVSDNPAAVQAALMHETLGVITVVFQEYTESLNAASKSAGTE